MNSIDLSLKIESVASKIKHHTYFNQAIPNELQLEINKLMCDYNEQLKAESNGK